MGIHQRTKFTSALLFSFPSACKVAEIHRDKDHRRDNNQAGGEEASKAKLINQSTVIHSTHTGERNAGRPGMSAVSGHTWHNPKRVRIRWHQSHQESLTLPYLSRLQHTLWF